MPTRSWRLPLLFAGALLVARIVFLLAGLDPAEERMTLVLDPARLAWSRVPERPLYDLEELYAGAAAEAIGMGTGVPLENFRFMSYGSGSLLVARLAAPIQRWFGTSYLTLKSIALVFTVAGGLFWLLLVREWLGETAARWFAGLYLFAPPVLVRTALIAKGDHAEAMAWIGGTLWLATLASTARGRRQRFVFAAAAGLAAGFGAYITYSTVPVTAGVAGIALMLTRGRPWRVWSAGAAGLAIGLVPWISTVAATSGAALEIYGRPLGSVVGWSEFARRTTILARRGLGAGYDLPGPPFVRDLAGWIWLAAVAIGGAALVRSFRSRAAQLLIGGLLAQLAAWMLLAPDPSSRYLVPGYPLFLIAVSALGGNADPSRVGGRSWRSAVAAAALLLGLGSQTAVVATSSFRALRGPLEGTCWPLFGKIVGRRLTNAQIESFPERVRPHLWFGAGMRIRRTARRAEWPMEADLAGPDRGAVWEGIGYSLANSGTALDPSSSVWRLPAEAREHVLRGIELAAENPIGRDGPAAASCFEQLAGIPDAAVRARFGRAMARAIAVMATQGVVLPAALEKRALELFDGPTRQRGAGWSLYREVDRDRGLVLWSPPSSAWTGAEMTGPLREASLDFVQGVADAFEWDLSRYDPAWLLGEDGVPRTLAAEVELATSGLDAARAALLHRAAARAAARALKELSPRLDGAAWRWREAIPAPFHDAFQDALATTDSRRPPGPAM